MKQRIARKAVALMKCDQWWADVQPLLVNESVTNIPTINSFKELYYKQFGGSPSHTALRRMDPTKTPSGDGDPKAEKKRKRKAKQGIPKP